ncbi:hypothetical protein ACVWXM_000127 [Bradyrhizobium sp. GM7.3]
MRAVDREPLFPILLRRGVLLALTGVRSLVAARWRSRMREERLAALIQASLSVATTRANAIKPFTAWLCASLIGAGGQAPPDPASALCARQAVQARQPEAQHAADLSRPRALRHLAARSRTRASSRRRLQSYCRWHGACANSSSVNAGTISIPRMRRRSNTPAKAKAHRPNEFGVKVSVATTICRASPMESAARQSA